VINIEIFQNYGNLSKFGLYNLWTKSNINTKRRKSYNGNPGKLKNALTFQPEVTKTIFSEDESELDTELIILSLV